MDILKALPMAVVMVAGPQVVSAIFLATSRDARRNSLAFLTGAAVATTVGLTIVYVIVRLVKPSDPSSGDTTQKAIDYVIVALLLFLMVRVFVKRKVTRPPKWMSRLQTATPKFSRKLGFLLFLIFPTDVIAMITVGAALANHGAPWWHNLVFVALTVILASIPLLILLLLGHRAQTMLPKLRDWMNSHSWIINEAVLGFFLVMSLTS